MMYRGPRVRLALKMGAAQFAAEEDVINTREYCNYHSAHRIAGLHL